MHGVVDRTLGEQLQHREVRPGECHRRRDSDGDSQGPSLGAPEASATDQQRGRTQGHRDRGEGVHQQEATREQAEHRPPRPRRMLEELPGQRQTGQEQRSADDRWVGEDEPDRVEVEVPAPTPRLPAPQDQREHEEPRRRQPAVDHPVERPGQHDEKGDQGEHAGEAERGEHAEPRDPGQHPEEHDVGGVLRVGRIAGDQGVPGREGMPCHFGDGRRVQVDVARPPAVPVLDEERDRNHHRRQAVRPEPARGTKQREAGTNDPHRTIRCGAGSTPQGRR